MFLVPTLNPTVISLEFLRFSIEPLSIWYDSLVFGEKRSEESLPNALEVKAL